MKKNLSPNPFLLNASAQSEQPTQAARAVFPCGIYQPEGSFRFSADALLLGSFIKNPPGRFVADLGAGCGIVGLTYLMAQPEAVAVGFEIQPDLVEAANRNAVRLGFSQRYFCIEADVTLRDFKRRYSFHSALRKNTGIKRQLVIKNSAIDVRFDIVLANPPYRVLGTGRLPQSVMRQKALFAPEGTLGLFCKAAHAILAPHGVFGVVFLAEQASSLYETLLSSGFQIKRVLPVHGREGKPPTLVLVEARKANDTPQSTSPRQTPLVLYDKDNRLTDEARQFCPYLG